MDPKKALQKRVAEIEATASQDGQQGLDIWDSAEHSYLTGLIGALEQEAPESIHEKLLAELPELEEAMAHENAAYTFDWYDDHYYNKIYSGQLKACRFALSLFS